MRSLHHYMQIAIKQAKLAADQGEVPVGAVLVDSTGLVKQVGHNQVIQNSDPTCHAEINVIRMECAILKNERLTGYRLFSTLEPCPMCSTAISLSRISELVYGASDEKSGGVTVGPRIFSHAQIHHKPKIVGGIEASVCSNLLKGFFKSRR